MNVYLIGYRGAGKSAVGRALARRLARPFVDMDDALCRRIGMSIREAVERFGWPAFRKEEKRLLGELCAPPDRVVSTGGGVVLDEENVGAMRSSGTVVWLQASPETLYRRIAADARSAELRPPLDGFDGGLEEIEAVLAGRSPLYARAAHLRLDTERLSEAEVLRRLIDLLKTRRALRTAAAKGR